MATLTLDPSAVSSFTTASSGPVQTHIRSLAQKVRDQADFRVPRSIREGRQGPHLGDTITVTDDGDGYLVGSDLPHALVHHTGARPHPIPGPLSFRWARFGMQPTVVPAVPRGRGVLRGPNVWIILKGRVDHPGHAGNEYLLQPLREVVQGG